MFIKLNYFRKPLKEPTQLLDFEKYLLRQAELTKQKKLLKRNKDCKNEKEKETVKAKKMKIDEVKNQKEKKTEIKSSKKISKKTETVTSQSQKSRYSDSCHSNSLNAEESENNIMYLEGSETSNTLIFEQIAKVRNTFGLNEDCDESGSEYVPSDEYDSAEETIKSDRKRKHTIKECTSRRKRGNIRK